MRTIIIDSKKQEMLLDVHALFANEFDFEYYFRKI